MFLLFILAIFTLGFGHYFKMLMWKQFIEIYELPNDKVLLRSLFIGYVINYYLPFRILGDFFRALYSGKRMKNGVSFSLATIIVGRYLDIIVVGIIFLLLSFTNLANTVIISSAKFYTILALLLLLLAIISIKYSNYPKIILKKLCHIFNSNIELRLLKFTWCFISSFKDMYEKLNRKKLLLNMMSMWFLYLLSYYLFSVYISSYGGATNVIDVLTLLFSNNNLGISTISMTYHTDFGLSFSLLMGIYIVSPLLILLVLSLIPHFDKNSKRNSNKNMEYLNLLPHVNEQDKFKFLDAYFSGKSNEYLKNYLKINRGISILQDYSAGSNATTMLCFDEQQTFFRKYAFGSDGDKLYNQIEWIYDHKKKLPLTSIIREQKGDGYCYYDMPYNKAAIGFFNYVHSTYFNRCWALLRRVLRDLDRNLHSVNVKEADKETINKYIQTKVIDNINKIENAKEIKALLKYDELMINGVRYKNLNVLKKYLSFDYLYNVFKDDLYSDIHGDLTIENIICVQNINLLDKYYIIDPNTGNLHNSPNLDYAKLLQSLHGGYEFLMHTKGVEVYQNNINFLYTKSEAYEKLYQGYRKYLEKHFSAQKVKSIFFHEIIHWLRLMPYKIEKDQNRAVLFYAGLIKVLNEVIEMYGDK